MSGMIDGFDVFLLLQARCRAAGSQRAWARANGIPEAEVSDVLHARKKEPTARVLKALGLRRVVSYSKLSNSDEAAA